MAETWRQHTATATPAHPTRGQRPDPEIARYLQNRKRLEVPGRDRMGTAWNSRTPCPAPNPGPPAAPARQVEIAKGFRCGNTPECLRRCPRRVLRRAGRSRPRFSLVERHTMPNGQRQHRDALTSSGQPGQRSAWQSTTAPPAGPVICWPAPPPAPGRPALTTSAQHQPATSASWSASRPALPPSRCWMCPATVQPG